MIVRTGGKMKLLGRKFTKEQFIEAVQSSFTFKSVAQKLGMRFLGNYKTIHRYIKEFDLDISHFNKNAYKSYSRFKLEDILVENSNYNRCHLKARILKENLLEYKCDECGISSWHGRNLSLQLDHKNGIWNDNRIENLRLLCPNCHSLTENFSGKALRNKVEKQENFCNCGKAIYKTSKVCHKCHAESQKRITKINWPPVEQIIEKLKTMSYTALGKELGVSDNAVRKYIERSFKCPPK